MVFETVEIGPIVTMIGAGGCGVVFAFPCTNEPLTGVTAESAWKLSRKNLFLKVVF